MNMDQQDIHSFPPFQPLPMQHQSAAQPAFPTSQPNSAGMSQPSRMSVLCFFWDIENCPIPREKSAVDIAAMLRNEFVVPQNRKEEDFIVVCDGTKESKESQIEMNNAQITINHIPAVSKNAADDKLRSLMRKFGDAHQQDDVVVLISGDINFQRELHELRYQQHLYTIVIHPAVANNALLSTANEHHSFEALLDKVPIRSGVRDKTSGINNIVIVDNLPRHQPDSLIRNRLSQLVGNTGGRVEYTRPTETSMVIVFPNAEAARRSCSRIHGEDVCGSSITATFHPQSEHAGYDRRVNNDPSMHQSLSLPAFRPFQPNQLYSSRLPVRPPPRAAAASHMFPWSIESGRQLAPQTVLPPKASPPNVLTTAVGAPKLYTPFIPTSAQAALLHHSQSQPSKITSKAAAPSSTLLGSGDANANSTYFKRNLKKKLSPVAVETTHVYNGKVSTVASASKPSSSELVQSMDKLSFTDAGASAMDRRNGGMTKLIFLGNLDAKFSPKQLKKELLFILADLIPNQAPVMTFCKDTAGETYAKVEFSDAVDAEFMVSWLSKRKLGEQLLTVFLENPDVEPSVALRMAVIEVFKSRNKLEVPMFELFAAFHRLYDQDLDSGTLRRMPIIVKENETNGKRTFQLLPSALPWSLKMKEQGKLESLPLGYCPIHCPTENVHELLTAKVYRPLMFLKMNIQFLGRRVNEVLREHGGSLPLSSFMLCFVNETINIKEDSENGAYLEHLLLAIPNVTVIRNLNQPAMLSTREEILVPPQAGDRDKQVLEQLIWDILIARKRSALPIPQFAEIFYRKLNRSCPGDHQNIEKLVQSVRSLSADFEIIGIGADRVVTLSHEAQKRRFDRDLEKIRLLRPGKPLHSRKQFMELYAEVYEKPFPLVDYGVSNIEDIFIATASDSPQKPLVRPTASQKIDIPVTIPKPAGNSALKSLALEARTVLLECPAYKTDIVDFVGRYHKITKKQLKLKTMGYAKLTDLLEDMSSYLEVSTVSVSGKPTVFVALTKERRIEHISEVVRDFAKQGTDIFTVEEMQQFYNKLFPAHLCKAGDYGYANFWELFAAYPTIVEVDKSGRTPVLRMRTRNESGDSADNGTQNSSFSDQNSPRVGHVGDAVSSRHNAVAETANLMGLRHPDSGLDSDDKDGAGKAAGATRRLAISLPK